VSQPENFSKFQLALEPNFGSLLNRNFAQNRNHKSCWNQNWCFGSGANAINISGLLNPKKLGNFKN